MALAGRARDPCEGPLAACLLCLAIWAIIIHDVGVVQAADVAGNATLVWTSGFPLTLEFRRAFPISVTMSKAFDFCIPTRSGSLTPRIAFTKSNTTAIASGWSAMVIAFA
jgi:hypothetical protein